MKVYTENTQVHITLKRQKINLILVSNLYRKKLILLFTIFFVCHIGRAQSPVLKKTTIIGKVVAITDGDTFKLLEKDSILHRVRVANIDCPERKQPFSKRAKEFTSDAIFNKVIKIEVLKIDRYGRLVALVYYDKNKNLSKELVKHGYAWHYIKYSNDSMLTNLETIAKNARVGLWQDDNAIPPWKWRAKKN